MNKGFTLVEVLVALAIGALIAILAYSSVMQTQDAVDQQQRQQAAWQSLDRTFVWLQRDLQQVVSPPTPTADLNQFNFDRGLQGASPASMEVIADGVYLKLVREGWRNPLQRQRSDLQAVAYVVRDKALWRLSAPLEPARAAPELATDIALQQRVEQEQRVEQAQWGEDVARQDTLWQVQLLLDDVSALQLAFLPKSAQSLNDDAWDEVWPVASSSALAVALNVSVSTAVSGGQVHRLFLIPAGMQP